MPYGSPFEHTILKVCTACGLEKPLDQFYVARTGKYGRAAWCSLCKNLKNKRWRTSPEGMKVRSGQMLYGYAKRTSECRAKIAFELTREQFYFLRGHACLYCGGPLPPLGSGLDRIDNSTHYKPGNVVPCCGECNTARQDHFTPEEMLAEIGPAIRRVRITRGESPSPQGHLGTWIVWRGGQ